MRENWPQTQDKPDVYGDDDKDVMFNRSTKPAVQDLENMRDPPSIEDFSHDDLEIMLMEEGHERVAEPPDEGVAMAQAVDSFVDTLKEMRSRRAEMLKNLQGE